MPKVKGLPVPSSILADEATSSKDLDSMRIAHTRAADAVTPSSSVTAAPTRSLRSSQQAKTTPPGPAPAAGSVAERNMVALRNWSFAKLVASSKHLGFRAVGKLAYHPHRKQSSYGADWFSTEIQSIHSNGIVVSSNMSLYKLDGPAAPELHNTPDRLAKMMQPFSCSTWPSNAQSLFQQVSEFFRSEENVSPPPQPSRAVATPVSETSDKRGSDKNDDEGDENDKDGEEDDEDDDEPPPPRRKPGAASKQKPRASATKVKSSVSKPKAKANAKGQPPNARISRSQTLAAAAASGLGFRV